MSNSPPIRTIFPIALLYLLCTTALVLYTSSSLSGTVSPELSRSICLAILAANLACLILISLLLARSISRRERTLDRIRRQLEDVGQGHIRADQQEQHGSALDKAMKGMCSFLDQTLVKIITASGGVYGSMLNLRSAAEQCASGASHQNDQAHTLAAAAEEMSRTIADISRNASTAEETSLGAMEIVTEGKSIVDRAVMAASLVESSTDELAGGVEELRNSVMEISDIVAVIEEIADQTNLLALNAAIEAARSGEHGRGFAVVADEVRNLASRTIKATGDISDRISAVQKETLKTSSSMQESSRQVRNARDRISEVEGSLARIATSFESVNGQITQIATAVEQQTETTRQISSAIEETSQMTETLTGVSTRVMEETSRLGSITDELLLVLGAFHLGAHYSAAAAMEGVAASESLRSLERNRQEQELRSAARKYPFVELFYVTDAGGRQVTSNISTAPVSEATTYAGDGFGMDWSGRPWCRGVRESGATFISELYRSAATGSFCCTIAVPVVAADGRMTAILGADIDVAMISSLH